MKPRMAYKIGSALTRSRGVQPQISFIMGILGRMVKWDPIPEPKNENEGAIQPKKSVKRRKNVHKKTKNAGSYHWGGVNVIE